MPKIDYNAAQTKYLFAFLVTVLVASVISVFPESYDTMNSWADQKKALANLQKAVSLPVNEEIGLTWAGPGWLAFAKVAHHVLGINLESSLIFINRVSYLTAVFIFSVFVFTQVRVKKKSLADYSGEFVLIATFFLSVNFTYFSTIPWSHFIALPFSCLFILLLCHYKHYQFYHYIFIGVVVGFLATIRMFSAQAIFAAVGVWFVYLLWRRKRTLVNTLNKSARIFALCSLGFVIAYLINGLILGELIIYNQYEGMTPYPLSELYSLRLTDFPVKFIQLFIDPCFLTDCSLNQWNKATVFIVNEVMDSVNSWTYPLILQIPIIGWVVFSFLIYLVFYWRYIPKLLDDPAVAISLIAAGAIIIGYSTALLAGADRLKFGYVRDFMDATFFLAMAAIRAMVLLNNLKEPKLLGVKKLLIISAAPIISIGLLQVSVSGNNFISFPDYVIKKIDAEIDCNYEECYLNPYYITSSGRHNFPLMFDDVVMKTTCAESGKSVFWYGKMSEYAYKRNQCDKGATIVFIPTLIGPSTKIVDPGYDGEYGGKIRIDWYPDYHFGDQILFGLSGNDVRYIEGDWSYPEKSYRWTDDKSARMSMSIDNRKPFILTANIAGYIRKAHPEVYVDVLIEEMLVDRWVINTKPFQDNSIVVPADVIPLDRKLDIEFVIHNPISPLDLGESLDSRDLGLAFRSVSMSPIQMMGK